MAEMFGRYPTAARARQDRRILKDWHTTGVRVQKDTTGRLYICAPYFLIAREADEYGALASIAEEAQPGSVGVTTCSDGAPQSIAYDLIERVENWRAHATERLTLDTSDFDKGKTSYSQLRGHVRLGLPVNPELLSMFGNWRTLRYYQNPDEQLAPVMATMRNFTPLGFIMPMQWNRGS